jgi:hypothetical protein
VEQFFRALTLTSSALRQGRNQEQKKLFHSHSTVPAVATAVAGLPAQNWTQENCMEQENVT